MSVFFFNRDFIRQVNRSQNPTGNYIFKGIFYLHIQQNNLSGRDHDQKTGGWRWGVGDKNIDQFFFGFSLDFSRSVRGYKSQGPDPFARILKDAGLAEFFSPLVDKKD